MTNTGIDEFVKSIGCNLESFNISFCGLLTDASLSSISNHCPNLRSITLGYNHKEITSDGIMRLIRKCEKLVHYKCLDIFSDFPQSLLIRHLIAERKKLLKIKWFKYDEWMVIWMAQKHKKLVAFKCCFNSLLPFNTSGYTTAIHTSILLDMGTVDKYDIENNTSSEWDRGHDKICTHTTAHLIFNALSAVISTEKSHKGRLMLSAVVKHRKQTSS